MRDMNQLLKLWDGSKEQISAGDRDSTCSLVPEELYSGHVYIKSGVLPFKRVVGNDRHAMVYESLYMNFENKNEGLW